MVLWPHRRNPEDLFEPELQRGHFSMIACVTSISSERKALFRFSGRKKNSRKKCTHFGVRPVSRAARKPENSFSLATLVISIRTLSRTKEKGGGVVFRSHENTHITIRKVTWTERRNKTRNFIETYISELYRPWEVISNNACPHHLHRFGT